MAKRRVKRNYTELYEEKYKEVRKVIGQVTKAGYKADREFLQQVRATRMMPIKEAYRTIKDLSVRVDMQARFYKIDEETGERISLTSELFDRLMEVPRGYEYGDEVEYNANAPRYAEIAVANFKMELQTYSALIANKTSADGMSSVEKWFYGLLDQYGTEAVGLMLMQASEHGIQLSFEVMYDSTSATNFINSMMDFLDTSGQTDIQADTLKDIQSEINDGERLMEDENGNPII